MHDILKMSKYVFHRAFMRVYMQHVFPSSSDDSDESDQGAGAGHRAAEGSRESRPWRSVVIGEQEHRIDMKSIEPYKRVISHGGSHTHFILLSLNTSWRACTGLESALRAIRHYVYFFIMEPYLYYISFVCLRPTIRCLTLSTN